MKNIEKMQIRQNFLALRNGLSPEVREEKSGLLYRRLVKLEPYINADMVFLFASFGSEPDTYGLIRECLSAGRKVALPKIYKDGKMEFMEIDSLDGLVSGRMGVPYPSSGKPAEPRENANTLIVVPGVAFGRDFYRIGYGGGYYDRYLSRYPACYKIGLCFQEQLTDALPHENFDRKLDGILTDSELLANRTYIGKDEFYVKA